MALRERFSGSASGVACPLCLSKSCAVVACRDPSRGLIQTIYRCEGCKSFFGDPGDAAERKKPLSD
jgi:hypothetical protein